MLESGALKICRGNKQIGLPKNEKTLPLATNGMHKQMIRVLVAAAANKVIEGERQTSNFLYSSLVKSKLVTGGFAPL